MRIVIYSNLEQLSKKEEGIELDGFSTNAE